MKTKLNFSKKVLLASSLALGIINVSSFFNKVQATGTGNPPPKTHSCLRQETSPTHATLDCIGSGSRCASVSDC